MTERNVRFKLFHLIKDISETTEEKKTKDGTIRVTVTTIKRRYILRNKISWLLDVNTYTYTFPEDKKPYVKKGK